MAEAVKHGTWLYDGVVPSTVVVMKFRDGDLPRGPEEERVPGYPPRDEDGFFYGVEYFVHGAAGISKGVGGELFASALEAVQQAEATLKYPIVWEDTV